MRALLYAATVLMVMGLAFWAYRENYRTQAAIDDMNRVQNEIAGLREQLGVLRAEWAFLNRPERLRELVDLNFDRLRLVPVQADQFVDTTHVDYPAPREPDPLSDADPMADVDGPADGADMAAAPASAGAAIPDRVAPSPQAADAADPQGASSPTTARRPVPKERQP